MKPSAVALAAAEEAAESVYQQTKHTIPWVMTDHDRFELAVKVQELLERPFRVKRCSHPLQRRTFDGGLECGVCKNDLTHLIPAEAGH